MEESTSDFNTSKSLSQHKCRDEQCSTKFVTITKEQEEGKVELRRCPSQVMQIVFDSDEEEGDNSTDCEKKNDTNHQSRMERQVKEGKVSQGQSQNFIKRQKSEAENHAAQTESYNNMPLRKADHGHFNAYAMDQSTLNQNIDLESVYQMYTKMWGTPMDTDHMKVDPGLYNTIMNQFTGNQGTSSQGIYHKPPSLLGPSAVSSSQLKGVEAAYKELFNQAAKNPDLNLEGMYKDAGLLTSTYFVPPSSCSGATPQGSKLEGDMNDYLFDKTQDHAKYKNVYHREAEMNFPNYMPRIPEQNNMSKLKADQDPYASLTDQTGMSQASKLDGLYYKNPELFQNYASSGPSVSHAHPSKIREDHLGLMEKAFATATVGGGGSINSGGGGDGHSQFIDKSYSGRSQTMEKSYTLGHPHSQGSDKVFTGHSTNAANHLGKIPRMVYKYDTQFFETPRMMVNESNIKNDPVMVSQTVGSGTSKIHNVKSEMLENFSQRAAETFTNFQPLPASYQLPVKPNQENYSSDPASTLIGQVSKSDKMYLKTAALFSSLKTTMKEEHTACGATFNPGEQSNTDLTLENLYPSTKTKGPLPDFKSCLPQTVSQQDFMVAVSTPLSTASLNGPPLVPDVRPQSPTSIPSTTTSTPKMEKPVVKKPPREKRHKCEFCGKAFGRSSDLKRHTRIHTGERNHVCPVCDKRFNQSGDVVRHMKTHTGEKPYPCEICGKPFSQKGDMKIHMRIHTGERPHVCSVCHKAFNQSSYLTTHMKSHTGDRRHKCVVCNKAFIERSDLRKHERIHTGEKPHECSICKKAFNRNNNLIRHIINIHTKEKPARRIPCVNDLNVGVAKKGRKLRDPNQTNEPVTVRRGRRRGRQKRTRASSSGNSSTANDLLGDTKEELNSSRSSPSATPPMTKDRKSDGDDTTTESKGVKALTDDPEHDEKVPLDSCVGYDSNDREEYHEDTEDEVDYSSYLKTMATSTTAMTVTNSNGKDDD